MKVAGGNWQVTSRANFGRDTKLATLVELREAFDLDNLDTLVVGDGANDLGMIEAAGLGVAYHAKPTVAAAGEARIDHGDLTALLYAQGYRREEFVGEDRFGSRHYRGDIRPVILAAHSSVPIDDRR